MHSSAIHFSNSFTLASSDPSPAREHKACSVCLTTITSSWRRNPENKTLVACRSCYEAYLAKRSNKICSNCLSIQKSTWRKDPQDKARDLCMKCYADSLANRIDKVCAICSFTGAKTRWHKDPEDKMSDVCNRCYARAIKKINREPDLPPLPLVLEFEARMATDLQNFL